MWIYELSLGLADSVPLVRKLLSVPEHTTFEALHQMIDHVFHRSKESVYKFVFPDEEVCIAADGNEFVDSDGSGVLSPSLSIDRWMTKKRKFYYLTGPDDQLKVAVYVKAMTQLKRPVSGQDKAGESKALGARIGLSDMLVKLGKKELISLAKRHRISGYSHLNKSQLTALIAGHLLKKDVMRRYMLCMNDEEMEAFLHLIENDDAVSDYEAQDFSFLIVGGYVGFTENLELVVPETVIRVFETINTNDFQKQRRRVIRIGDYAHIANALYGVTPPMQVVKLFNRYERKKTDWDEVFRTYQLISAYRCEFIYKDVYFVDRYYADEYKKILEIQGNIPFYMPAREQLEQWINTGTIQDIKLFIDIYTYMIRQLWVEDAQAGAACMMMWEKTRAGCDLHDLIDTLETSGIRCKSHRQIETMGQMVLHLWKNTRMICYRGYSPGELPGKK